jgi:hypothetical protein
VGFVVAFAKGRGSFCHCEPVDEKELERRTSDGVERLVIWTWFGSKGSHTPIRSQASDWLTLLLDF